MATTDNLPVKIGDRRYQADLTGFGWAPTESQRQLQDSSREPSDATLANPAIWKRTATDFILGSGQDYLDQEDESERRRFRKSKGIDVWNRRQIALLPDVDLAHSIGGLSESTADMVVVEDYIYSLFDFSVSRFDGSTWVNCSGLPGFAKQLAVVGGHVYVANSSTLARCAIGATAYSAFGSSTPKVIGTAGGRLVGGDGADLFEINADGSTTPIYTHFEGSGFEWTKIIGAPNGIYCFGDDGARTVGYLLTVVDATGALAPPYPVIQMPDGEFIRDVLFFGGVLVLATNLGTRLATINGSGFLTAGPLTELGDIRCLGTDGFDIWFGWTNYDSVSTGLGRMRPSRFIDTLVPAYASDLMATNQGTVLACCSFQGERHFVMSQGGTARYYRQSTNKVASGDLHTGIISYATPEDKGIHSIELSYDALPAGSRVRGQLAESMDAVPVAGGVDDSTTASTSQRGSLATVLRTEEAEVVITLNRATDATDGPVVRRWTLRAIPMPFKSVQITLAIMLQSKVTHQQAGSNLQEIPQSPLEEFDYLNGLMEDRTIVDVIIGAKTREMLVDYVGMGPDVQSVGARGWTGQQDWIEGTWTVRLLSVEPTQ